MDNNAASSLKDHGMRAPGERLGGGSCRFATYVKIARYPIHLPHQTVTVALQHARVCNEWGTDEGSVTFGR
jgi:hypothetical protein